VSDDPYHHDKKEITPAQWADQAALEIGLAVNKLCIHEPRCEQPKDNQKGEPIYAGGPKLKGRAIEKLIQNLPLRPWSEHRACILEDLRDPKRVHVDPLGNVHLCQGISIGNILQQPLSRLLKNYDPDSHPICGPLLKGGPAQLARHYEVAVQPGYVDACHMCSMVCKALMSRFPEILTPSQVYGVF
jgi:hypothetical protein